MRIRVGRVVERPRIGGCAFKQRAVVRCSVSGIPISTCVGLPKPLPNSARTRERGTAVWLVDVTIKLRHARYCIRTKATLIQPKGCRIRPRICWGQSLILPSSDLVQSRISGILVDGSRQEGRGNGACC